MSNKLTCVIADMEVFYQKQRRFCKWLWRTFWLNTMYRDAYYMGWDAALENAEALKPSHNPPHAG